jgi:hypothetical protein
MGKKEENKGFVCILCQGVVHPLKNGSYRNHCPFCLASVHVDGVLPGDRKSTCSGIMKPTLLKKSSKKGWQILHVCLKCGFRRCNKIAELDPQSDDWKQIVRLPVG